jgi:hypothetical protein
MAVHRFGLRGTVPRAKTRDRDQQEGFDEDEHHDRPPEDVLEQTGEVGAEIGSGSEHRLRELSPTGARGEKEQEEDEY